MNDTPATLTVDSAHYATLRDALLAVREDLSSVVSILSTEADNGAGFVAAAYTELRRRLVQGRLSQSEEIGQLIAVVLEVQEGGSDDELAENRIHRESLRWLSDGIGAVLAQDPQLGIKSLRHLTEAVYCDESLVWVAWLWIARAATETGDFEQARKAAEMACELADALDAQAVSTSLCAMGEVEMGVGDYEAALHNLERAAEGFEKLDDRRGLATAFLTRARAMAAAGRDDDAIKAADKAHEIDDSWEQPGAFLARRAMIGGDLDRARELLSRFESQQQRPDEIERELAVLAILDEERLPAAVVARYLQLCDQLPSDDVLSELESLAGANPAFLQLRELLAWTYVKLGNDDAAAREFGHLAEQNLGADLQSSVLLGLGCLANRRNQEQQSSRRVSATASAVSSGASTAPSVSTAAGPTVVGTAKDGSKLELVSDDDDSEEDEPPRQEREPARQGSLSTSPAASSSHHTVDQKSAPKAVFTGDLQLFAVPDLLEFLKSSRRTGTLVVTSENGIGAVHLRDGMLTGAASPRCTNIGDLLIAQGAINNDELRMATIAQEVDSPDRLLGELLVELGSVDADTVRGALRKQVFLAVKEMVAWTVGRFAFEPDKRSLDQTRSGVEIELDTQAVLLDVLRQFDEENKDG